MAALAGPLAGPPAAVAVPVLGLEVFVSFAAGAFQVGAYQAIT
jgi:hypothetical protein